MLEKTRLFVKERKNWPHLLTGLRIVLAPLVMWLLMSNSALGISISIVVIIIIAISDGLDGYCARKFGGVSDFGKIFDIMADVIANQAMFIALVMLGWLSPYVLFVIICREVSVGYLRIHFAVTMNVLVDAKAYGKAKTVTQFVSIIVVAVTIAAGKFGLNPDVVAVLTTIAKAALCAMFFMVIYSWYCYLTFFLGLAGINLGIFTGKGKRGY